MASKRMDLNKRTFFVLSGVSNPLGKDLALEMCCRFKTGSVALLIEASEERLQEIKKEILFLDNDIEVICCLLDSWQQADAVLFQQLIDTALNGFKTRRFERAFVLHNEGLSATQKLMEPQAAEQWQTYIQENLYAPVALNQMFLQAKSLAGIPKLVVNMTSSLQVAPFVFSSLFCSCKQARDMYFRAMANEERRNGVDVLSYAPGIGEWHKAEVDPNENVIDLSDLNVDEKIMSLPRVSPLQSTMKLINILEELSFVSGHEVDYYDTFVL